MNDKKKKGVMISLDFRTGLPPPSFDGLQAAKLVIPSNGLPRDDKVELEIRIATDFLNSLSTGHQLTISGIRTNNPNDPPDVLFNLNGETFGIELSELTPVNRLERDNVLNRLKASIISKLHLSPTTKDWVIAISLDSDYSKKIRARGLDNEIAQILTDFFSSNNMKLDQYNILNLPKNRGIILLYKADLSEEPQIEEENEPLLTFLGYNTVIFPVDDIPEIVEKTLKEKFSSITSVPSWLLLWSEHSSLASLDNEIILAIDQYCAKHRHPYEKVIYRSLRTDKYAILNYR